MNSKTKRPLLLGAAFLLCLALVYLSFFLFFFSSASAIRSNASAMRSSISDMPGGGSSSGGGGTPPFPLAMMQTQVRDCRLELENIRNITRAVSKGDTNAQSLYDAAQAIEDPGRRCTLAQRLYLAQREVYALWRLGRYSEALVIADTLSRPLFAIYLSRTSQAKLASYRGQSLWKLGRFAESIRPLRFALNFQEQTCKLDSEKCTYQLLANLRLNLAWSLVETGKGREAYCLFAFAETTVEQQNNFYAMEIMTSINNGYNRVIEVDSTLYRKADCKVGKPIGTRINGDGHSEIDLMMFVYLAGTLALVWIFGRVLIPRWLHLYRETPVRPSKDGHVKSDTKYQ